MLPASFQSLLAAAVRKTSDAIKADEMPDEKTAKGWIKEAPSE